MKIHLHYFASLREKFGRADELVELAAGVENVGQVRRWLALRGGVWAEALGEDRPVRAALARRMVNETALVTDGAELAFFPPVTGG